MDFYPPLNLENVFDRHRNDQVLANFGFNLIYNRQANGLNSVLKSKSHQSVQRPLNLKPLHFPNNSWVNLNEFNKFPKLLRKLGQNEKIFHGTNDSARSYIYRTVIISSEIDLYNNLDIVLKAIDEWKQVHPLLRCRVVTKQDQAKDKYFAFATEAKIASTENVQFLYYNSNSSKQSEDIWKLLVERESKIPLNGENGLLWRLTFFQIKNLTDSVYLYAVILTFDHCIMDGRSSYTSLLQLFSFIEDLYHNTYIPKAENPILPSKEDIYKSRKANAPQVANSFNYSKAPEFLDIENAAKSSYIRLKHLTSEEEHYGMIYKYDHTPYISVRELVDISKENNSKFRTLVVHKPDLSRILAKCKQNGVKLTTFLNMTIALAIKLIYEQFENDYYLKEVEPVINYTTNISLREFPEYQSFCTDKNGSIGCYIGLSINSLKSKIDLTYPNWTEDFWYLSNLESQVFHEKLDRGEFVHSIYLPNRKKERDKFFYHFGNSNLGVLPSSISEKRLIRIKQTFATGKYSRENFLCWFSNLIATVEGQLCWTISFNTQFIKQEIISLLVEKMTQIIKELIK